MASPEQIEAYNYVFAKTGDQSAALDAAFAGDPSAMHRIILRATCDALGMGKMTLIHGGRTSPIADARHVAMMVVREATKSSYPVIAKLFGGAHHSTVMAACSKVEARPELLAKAREILAAIEERKAA